MKLNVGTLTPDGDEARRWAEEELSRTVYAEAKPTLFDIWARDIQRFINDLFSGGADGVAAPIGIVVIVAIISIALIAALLYWGMPRRTHSVSKRSSHLLGADDNRSASQLRADAEKSARNGDYAAATIFRYRAIARSLLERDIINPAPGATAQAIARDAGGAFAQESAALVRAAEAFDDVRYAQHPGTAENYSALKELDKRLEKLSPNLVPA
jgi:hypothetical protein